MELLPYELQKTIYKYIYDECMKQLRKEQKCIKYFEKCLENSLNDYARNWIKNNCEQLGMNKSKYIGIKTRIPLEYLELRDLFIKYLNSVRKHFNMEYWQANADVYYTRVYDIYKFIGLKEEHARNRAEYIDDIVKDDSFAWGHCPSIFEHLSNLAILGP
jgi:hypothetical protein